MEDDILLDPDAGELARWSARLVSRTDELADPTTRACTGLALAGIGGAVVAGTVWELSAFLAVILGVIVTLLPLAAWGSIERRGRAVMSWCEDSALSALRARASALRAVHETLRAQLRALGTGSEQVVALIEVEFESVHDELLRDLWRAQRLSAETAQASADLARHARSLGFRLDRLLELAREPRSARTESERDLVENTNLGPVRSTQHTLELAAALAQRDHAQLEAGLTRLQEINQRLETLLRDRHRSRSEMGGDLATSRISDPRLLEALMEEPNPSLRPAALPLPEPAPLAAPAAAPLRAEPAPPASRARAAEH